MSGCTNFRITLTVFILLAAVLLAGCESGSDSVSSEAPAPSSGAQTAIPALAGARSLSNHYVSVTFADPADDVAEAASHYVITSMDDGLLRMG